MLGHLIDIPSLILVFSVVVAGLIVGRSNPHRGAKIAKDTCIGVGVVGILIGFVKMMAMMDDPDALAPAVSVALLTVLYGVAMYPFLHGVSQGLSIDPEKSSEVTLSTAVVASVVVMAVCLAGMRYSAVSIAIFFDPVAFLCFGAGVVLPAFLAARKSTPEERLLAVLRGIPRYSAMTSIVGTLVCFVVILQNFGDPTAIGPSIAIGFLTSLYCGMTLIVSSIVYGSLTDAEQPFQFLHTMIYFFANSALILITTSLMFSMIS